MIIVWLLSSVLMVQFFAPFEPNPPRQEIPSPASFPSYQPYNFFGELGLCQDGIDNDADGLIDCVDTECVHASVCSSPLPTPVPAAPNQILSPNRGSVTVSSVALAVAAAASTAVALVSAAAAAQSGPELVRSLLPFSAVHRRQTPWGRVVEAGSNTPIAGAMLSLLDEGGKVRATEKSRRDGTFGFFVPAGRYRIVVQHDSYQFPAPAPGIALFPGENVYDGGWIQVQEESILALVLAGQEITPTAFTNFTERLQGIWTRVQVWQARLAMPLLLVGGGLTVLSFWNHPSLLLGVLLIVYIILFALELLLSRVARRSVGVVHDALTNKGVGLAVVRLTDQFGRLIATRVTLASGHFFLMPAPGKYRVEIVHPNYQLFLKERLSVRKFFFGVAGIRARLTPR